MSTTPETTHVRYAYTDRGPKDQRHNRGPAFDRWLNALLRTTTRRAYARNRTALITVLETTKTHLDPTQLDGFQLAINTLKNLDTYITATTPDNN